MEQKCLYIKTYISNFVLPFTEVLYWRLFPAHHIKGSHLTEVRSESMACQYCEVIPHLGQLRLSMNSMELTGNSFVEHKPWWLETDGSIEWRQQKSLVFNEPLCMGSEGEIAWPKYNSHIYALIARFMGPTWGHLGPVGPRWAPCWSHELCYLGGFPLMHCMPCEAHVEAEQEFSYLKCHPILTVICKAYLILVMMSLIFLHQSNGP